MILLRRHGKKTISRIPVKTLETNSPDKILQNSQLTSISFEINFCLCKEIVEIGDEHYDYIRFLT